MLISLIMLWIQDNNKLIKNDVQVSGVTLTTA